MVFTKRLINLFLIAVFLLLGCKNGKTERESYKTVSIPLARFEIKDNKLDSVTALFEGYFCPLNKEDGNDITYTIRIMEDETKDVNNWIFIHAQYYDDRQYEHLMYEKNERLLGYIKRDSVEFLLFTNIQSALEVDDKLSKLIVPTNDYKNFDVRLFVMNRKLWRYLIIFDHMGVFSVYHSGRIDSIYMDYD